MFFEQRLIGSMANFGYVFGDPATKVAAVMDPSFDARLLQKVAGENGYSIGLIFNTHHHFDHVFDNERLANETGGQVAAPPVRKVREDPLLEGGSIVDRRGPQGESGPNPGPPPAPRGFVVSGRGLAV